MACEAHALKENRVACELSILVQANVPSSIPMKNLHALSSALISLAMISSTVAKPKTSETSVPSSLKNNPFAKESSLPYHLPPFDKIKNDDFMPAIEAGMQEQLKEIKAIASNSKEATFDNTIVAMERSGRLLDRAQRTFSNLNACNTNPEMQKIEKDLAPKLAAHHDAIFLDGQLFARVEKLYANRDKLGLDPQSSYLLERYSKDFVRAGAKLSAPDKEKLKAMNTELATLQTTFTQNVLEEKNASSVVVADKSELAGLTDAEIAAAAAAAKDEKQEGKFSIRLENTTGQPILGSMQNRALREKIMEASLARNSKGGQFDNRAVVIRIAQRYSATKTTLPINWRTRQPATLQR
jgi:peptidyl-dipeptidase Dcp